MVENGISSISDLLRILTNLGEPAEGHTRFFRGQGNAGWEILPGIYRNQKLVENEDKIIKEALLNCPDDFSPTDTLLEKLVKLQHYGYPTRLLDLTANALVGLYFACSNINHHDKDGELIILDIPNEDVKYDDSDTISVIASISLHNKDIDILESWDQALIEMALYQKSNIENFAKLQAELRYAFEERNEILVNKLEKKQISDNELIERIEQEKFDHMVFERFNQQKNIRTLLQIVRKDKPSFLSEINPKDLFKVYCVKTKLANSRIARQQGAFLIFSITSSKVFPTYIPESWFRKIERNKIIVKAESKIKILKELKAFGISKQTLFPELESQASEIIAQYSN